MPDCSFFFPSLFACVTCVSATKRGVLPKKLVLTSLLFLNLAGRFGLRISCLFFFSFCYLLVFGTRFPFSFLFFFFPPSISHLVSRIS